MALTVFREILIYFLAISAWVFAANLGGRMLSYPQEVIGSIVVMGSALISAITVMNAVRRGVMGVAAAHREGRLIKKGEGKGVLILAAIAIVLYLLFGFR